MKTLSTLLLVVGMFAPNTAASKPLRTAVEQLLSGFEYIPSRADLLRLGSDVDDVLREIAEHPSKGRELAHLRAINLLRHFPSPNTAAVLKRMFRRLRNVTRPSYDLLVLQEAMTTYAIVAGPKALAPLEPMLSHANRDVRYSAAAAVRLTANRAARTLLTQRLAVEGSGLVRRKIRKEVHQLDQEKTLRPNLRSGAKPRNPRP